MEALCIVVDLGQKTYAAWIQIIMHQSDSQTFRQTCTQYFVGSGFDEGLI